MLSGSPVMNTVRPGGQRVVWGPASDSKTIHASHSSTSWSTWNRMSSHTKEPAGVWRPHGHCGAHVVSLTFSISVGQTIQPPGGIQVHEAEGLFIGVLHVEERRAGYAERLQ